jgi:mycothiol synthase
MWFTVGPATSDDLTAACRALASARPQPDRDLFALRYRDMLTNGELDPAGLFVARDDSRAVRGAVLAQALPGALGLAWPPRANRGRDQAAVEDALVSAACGWLRERGVKVCQSFAAADERPDMAPLERGGFGLVTQVVHLRREIDPGRAARAVDPAACPLAFDPFTPDDREVFASTLLATYADSRDCPELTGTRTADELVDGFRGPCAVRRDWWYVVRHEGEPVGVILFDIGLEPGVLGLNYLGLVPAARGRGWADWLVRFAARVAAADDARALTLSVDVRNAPARRLYERHGFRETDRRDVYLAAWGEPGEPRP